MREVRTLCPYCGVGCGLLVKTDGVSIHGVRGDPDHPANLGRTCAKGATVAQTVNVATRARVATFRASKSDARVPVSTERAIAHVAERLNAIRAAHGPRSIAFYLSGQMTTEAQYLFNKFAKACIGTNHVDSNSRLCMSSAASGMALSFGSDGPPTSYADIELADTFLFIGSNAADCHPVTFGRVRRRVERARGQMIVVDPRRTATADCATIHLPIRPGTDLALLNGLLYLLHRTGQLDASFIASHTEGWEAVEAMLADYTPNRVAEICGLRAYDLRHVADVLGEAKGLISMWTMGVNQSVHGTFTNNAILNLHLALGQIGKPGSGPFSLTGQPNAMGGRDVGYMSHLLPGQRKIVEPTDRAAMEQFWGLPAGTIDATPGHDAVAMFDAIERGEIQALWVVGTNPAGSMPNLPRVRAALERCELVIVQDAYVPTETTAFADVILPAAVNLEQSGTFCNSERRVSLMQQVVQPPGDAKPDWWWAREVARAMVLTRGTQFADAAEIFDEFARSTAGRPNDQSALTYERLESQGPTQWPFPAMGRSLARRYEDRHFPTPTGHARFHARPFQPKGDGPSAEFPLLLTTGRVAGHWHLRTKTGNVTALNAVDPSPYVQMHPDDARALNLHDGQRVEVVSRTGRAWGALSVDDATSVGVVFMPMHWADLWSAGASPNETMSDACDPISREPALKYCAVRVGPYGVPEPAKEVPTLAVIAGGLGTRMGRPKATLKVAGAPILAWLHDRLDWPGPTLLVTSEAVGLPPGSERFDHHATDAAPNNGPLQGVLAALEKATTATVAIVAVDMPRVDRAMIEWLVAQLADRPAALGVMCQRADGPDKIDPFPCILRREAAELIRARLAEGRRSLHGLCADDRVHVLSPPSAWADDRWLNVNVPAQFDAFEASLAGQSLEVKR